MSLEIRARGRKRAFEGDDAVFGGGWSFIYSVVNLGSVSISFQELPGYETRFMDRRKSFYLMFYCFAARE